MGSVSTIKFTIKYAYNSILSIIISSFRAAVSVFLSFTKYNFQGKVKIAVFGF